MNSETEKAQASDAKAVLAAGMALPIPVGVKMAIAGVFDAETELTASEILDRITQPEKLQKMVALLRDRKLPATATRTDQGQAKPDQAGLDSDEIPF